jgi:hypothetical protein
MRLRVCACCLLLLAAYVSRGQQRPRVTGFFARGGYWATVQLAEGEPDTPSVVPVEVSGSRVKFTIRQRSTIGGTGKPAPDSVVNFDGTVGDAGLLLTCVRPPNLGGFAPLDPQV